MSHVRTVVFSHICTDESTRVYVKNTRTHTQSCTSCWGAFKDPSLPPSDKTGAGRDRGCRRGPGYLSHLSPINPPPSTSPTSPTCLQRHPCHSTNPVAPLLLLVFFFVLNAFQAPLTSPSCTALLLLAAPCKAAKHRGGKTGINRKEIQTGKCLMGVDLLTISAA